MAYPINKVLHNYEMLEQVLSQLQIKDLFAVQRVNSMWRDLIARSMTIQKKMFLYADGAPVEPISEPHGVTDYDAALRLNKALKFRCGDCEVRKGSGKGSGPGFVGVYAISIPRNVCSLAFSPFFNPGRKAEETSPSWHKMFLAQPPTTRYVAYHDSGKAISVENPFGVTFADMLDGYDRVTRFSTTRRCGPKASCYSIITLQLPGVFDAAEAMENSAVSDVECELTQWYARH